MNEIVYRYQREILKEMAEKDPRVRIREDGTVEFWHGVIDPADGDAGKRVSETTREHADIVMESLRLAVEKYNAAFKTWQEVCPPEPGRVRRSPLYCCPSEGEVEGSHGFEVRWRGHYEVGDEATRVQHLALERDDPVARAVEAYEEGLAEPPGELSHLEWYDYFGVEGGEVVAHLRLCGAYCCVNRDAPATMWLSGEARELGHLERVLRAFFRERFDVPGFRAPVSDASVSELARTLGPEPREVEVHIPRQAWGETGLTRLTLPPNWTGSVWTHEVRPRLGD
ncbi:MAG: hypothetical protein ACTSU5_07030 [Promethearchaeota archaeon]